MPTLKGSQTESNLKAAFAFESQTHLRYEYFAQKADIEGYSEVAAMFRSAAAGEFSHAQGHLELLETCGDPITELPIGDTPECLSSAVSGETRESAESYPEMARIARQEGFEDIAAWFDILTKAEKKHAERFRRALEILR